MEEVLKVDQNDSPKKPFLNEAILLALIPFLANMLVFVYFVGYFSYFNLPYSLISIGINDIFNYSVLILIFIPIIILFFDGILYFLNSIPIPRPIKSRIANTILVSLLPYLLYRTNSVNKIMNLIAVLLLIFCVGKSFVFPLLNKKLKGKKYIQKLTLEDEETQKRLLTETSGYKKKFPLISLVEKYFGKLSFGVMLLFFFVIIILFEIGWSKAENQVKYHVLNTNPETVVLFMRSDDLIITHFSRETKSIENNFRIINYGEDSNLEFTLENIGPLSVK